MGKSLSDAARKLRSSATRLNALTDEAAECVKDVENFLGEECSIGIPAFVKVAPLGPDGDGAQYLEYRRVGNRFRIAVVWGWENDPENETVKPWSDCSRDDKLETLKKLPDLLVALTENVDTRITEAEATMESISAVLDPLKAEGGA